MWRLLLLAALFYLIILVGRGLLSSRKGSPHAANGEKVFVQDALTGVYFPKSDAVTVTTDGETYHFSSIENRDSWLSRRGGRS